MRTSSLTLLICIFLVFNSITTLAQNNQKKPHMNAGKTDTAISLVEKYKDFLVPENLIFESKDGLAKHYRITETMNLTTIYAISSGTVYRSSSTSTPVKNYGELRIQNESSTGCSYGFRSWVKYNISDIPVGSTINDVDQYVYCTELNEGFVDFLNYDIYRVDNDPIPASGTTLWTDIYNGNIYENDEWVSNPPAWEWSDLNNPADNDFQNALPTGWFALGYMVECNENDDDYYAVFRGYTQPYKPYLAVTYDPPVYTLTVNSTNPSSGVNISVNPSDNNGNSNGTTTFIRYYNSGTNVGLIAPISVGGNNFEKWLINGSLYSENRQIQRPMDDDYTLTAVFYIQPILTVTPSNRNVTSSSGYTTFSVSSNISWSASDNVNWLSVSPTSGSGDRILTATYSANSNTSTRTATITVSGGGITRTVTVIQDEYVGIINITNEIPKNFTLYQNFPNPFNPMTTLRYDLPQKEYVRLMIYDLLGHEVKGVVNRFEEPGYKTIIWDGTDGSGRPVRAGVYLCVIRAGDFSQSMKMVLLK